MSNESVMLNCPCETCENYPTCTHACETRRKWFPEAWREIRKLFREIKEGK